MTRPPAVAVEAEPDIGAEHEQAIVRALDRLADGIVAALAGLLLVAAFLALRLYSVLGKRTGHEQQPLPRAAVLSSPAIVAGRRVIVPLLDGDDGGIVARPLRSLAHFVALLRAH